eukprot:1152232-Rhodomonas_salina.3
MRGLAQGLRAFKVPIRLRVCYAMSGIKIAYGAVLASRMVLAACAYAMRCPAQRTVLAAYAYAMRCPAGVAGAREERGKREKGVRARERGGSLPILLRARYAMSGTAVVYDAAHSLCHVRD